MKTTATNLSWWDRLMVAVTFAEAGEVETALTFTKDHSGKKETMYDHDVFEGHLNPAK